MTRYAFNREAFSCFVHVHRKVGRGMTMDEAAADMGITKAQLFRAEHKRPINNDAFVTICEWMGINPRCFVTDLTTGQALATPPDDPVSREALGETNEQRQALAAEARAI